ncbi:MAG TPA: hypothetical protein VF170_00815 [Planctomycetaceae bacterium]
MHRSSYFPNLPPLCGPAVHEDEPRTPDKLRARIAKAEAGFSRAAELYAHAAALPTADTPDPSELTGYPEHLRATIRRHPTRTQIITRAREHDDRLSAAVEAEIGTRNALAPVADELIAHLRHLAEAADQKEAEAVVRAFAREGFDDAGDAPVAVRQNVRWQRDVREARERSAAARSRREAAEAWAAANREAAYWLERHLDELRMRLRLEDHGIR